MEFCKPIGRDCTQESIRPQHWCKAKPPSLPFQCTVMLWLEWWIHLVLILAKRGTSATQSHCVPIEGERVSFQGDCSGVTGSVIKGSKCSINQQQPSVPSVKGSYIQCSKEKTEQCDNGLSSICGSQRSFLYCHAWEIILAPEMQSAESATAQTSRGRLHHARTWGVCASLIEALQGGSLSFRQEIYLA